MAGGRVPGVVGIQPVTIDNGTLARTNSQAPGTVGTVETEAAAISRTEELKLEIALDIGQLILDITGIIDPTPASDGTNAIISLARGRWFDAFVSAVSIVPYVGDTAKIAKLPRYASTIKKAIDLARYDIEWAQKLRGLFVKLKRVLDDVYKVSADTLPDSASKYLKEMKDDIDEFLTREKTAPGTKKGTDSSTVGSSSSGSSSRSNSSAPAQTPSQMKSESAKSAPEKSSPAPKQKPKPKRRKSAKKASKTTKQGGRGKNKRKTPQKNKVQKNGCPISMVTGEELLEQTDFVLPGPIPLVWERVYRTSHNIDIGLGAGWMMPWFSRLEIGEDEVVYFDGEGRDIPFAAPAEADGCVNEAEKLTLFCDSPDTYRVVNESGETYTYQGSGNYKRLTAIANNDGHAITFTYSDSNRLIRIADSAGRHLKLDYNITDHVRSVHLLNDNGEPVGNPLVQYGYDNSGDLISVIDGEGNKQHFSYRNHVITQRTTKDGFNYYFEWDSYDIYGQCIHNWGDNNIYDYRFEYDNDNKITRSTDGRGYTTVYHYNDFGHITKEIDPEGGVTHSEYNDKGQLTLQRDPQGGVTLYSYNQVGKLTKIVNPLGQATTLDYNDAGNPVLLTDAQGNQWRRQYDAFNRLSQTSDPKGNGVQYRYDGGGNPASVTDALGQTQSFSWDDQGNLASQTDSAGNVTRYTYDMRGQITKVTDSQGRDTRYGYDNNGNISQVIQPDGSSIQMRYTPEGRLTHYIDTAGRTTQYKYDGLSQPIARIDPNGKVFKYEYDKERNLTALVNENGERYQLHYDKNERLTKEIGFDGREQNYAYNAAGHLVSHRDGANRVTAFTRDELGRLLQKQSSDGELSLFEYDPIGRLIHAANDHAKLDFIYNPLGQLIAEKQNGERIEHRYDSVGQKVQTVLPNGKRIQYQYNKLGLFTHVAYNGEVITKVQRNAQGLETHRRSGDVSSQFEYDPMGRLVRQRSAKDQNPLIDRRYRYDKSGNLKQIDDFKQGTTKFRYDALDRLQAVEGFAAEQFSFDPAGNLLDTDQPASGGFVKGNRLHVFQDYRFEYDDAGNLVTEKKGKKETHFTYNAQNQLIKVEKEGQSFEYAYDPFGRRVSKKDAFGETSFLWDGDVLLSEQRNNIETTYIHEPGSFIPLCQVRDDKVYYYHNDHLGTPNIVTDKTGEVVWEARYKVYCNVVKYEVEAIENNIRFQGQYFDTETGLHYNRNRYYHPVIGRFTTVDPIGLLGGANNYEYAPNPVTWIDPLGLSCKENTWNEFQKHNKGQFSNSTEASSAYKKLVKEQSPWPDGFNPPEATLVPGTKFNMALSPNQASTRPGGFGTFDDIPDVTYVRNELAVKEAWKPDIDRVVSYDVTKPLPVKLGPVGPQVDKTAGKYLEGGGTQIEMLTSPQDRMSYLKIVDETPIK